MQYQLPIFENLCPSWESISHLGIRRAFPKGSQIISLETQVDGVYFVKEGLIEIVLYTIKGPEKVLFYVGPNCIFGEVSCFVSAESEEASVWARSDCVLYFFSKELIQDTIAYHYPNLLLELISAQAHKIKMYGVLLKDSLNSDNFIRVCKMLVYLARYKGIDIDQAPKHVLIQPELTQLDIARLMGIHRVTVTKAISRLKEMGIVRRFSKHSLEFIDFPALCHLIETSDIL
jgi:CRP-like cAMP-binding protein